MDHILPTRYPLDSGHPPSQRSPVAHPAKAGFPTPCTSAPTHDEHGDATASRLCVVDWQSCMHCQPGELYILSAVFQEQLVTRVFFDANAYVEGMVQEWLGEVKAACVWYFGRAHLETVPAGTLQTKL
ncbi:hypothetical protein HYDPIDRAFT_116060 [Hydnomerulius pinastri MD-312]|uniref:Uncharacterized protein n=1 Tax=Hydnomerulius pinastri MD-312 TaxID=994086 RepID=A0A0C9VTJ1_9AGAM|nr:hypothetical protein HYDPIDRAFT_116060 [Hydnomerulius pinastri MD-312]